MSGGTKSGKNKSFKTLFEECKSILQSHVYLYLHVYEKN